MNQPATVTIEITPEGDIIVEVHHVQGPICKALTQDLETSLGKVKSVMKKSDYCAIPLASGQQQKLQGGL
jgi:hypothetical protein